jgi:release factor glutamine methyltransferase
LFAGERGLDIYARLVPQAHRVLRSGGMLAVEIGFGQADAVRETAQGWTNPRLFADLAGIPRVLAFEKP